MKQKASSLFNSYTIHHVQVANIHDLKTPVGNNLYYIWWKQIPLGDLWVDDKSPAEMQPLKTLLAEKTKEAVDGYFSTTGKTIETDISKEILNKNAVEINALMEELLHPYVLRIKENTGSVSVVICTRNRPQELEKCINSLLQSSDTNFELIIIDNAPDDDATKNIVQKFPGVRYVLESRKGLDIARNTGAQNALNDIVVYTDDDVIIEKDWIKKVKNCFEDPKTMAVTGLVIPEKLDTYSQYVFERYWGFNKGYKPVVFDKAYFSKYVNRGVPVWDIGAGANMAFRKVIFEKVGYFDERLDVGAAGCSGDSEFWYRVLAEGWNCYYCPQLFAFHQHRDSEQALHKQIFHYMRGQIASLYVQHENYNHSGNMTRAYYILPAHYLRRLAYRALTCKNEYNSTLFTEIKGCFSGWKFYRSVRHKKNTTIQKMGVTQ